MREFSTMDHFKIRTKGGSRVESNYGLVWWAKNISFGLARFGSTKKSLVLVDICCLHSMPVVILCDVA